ncbi:TPA: hypothetical protein NIH00_005801 [Pseudomonas aeruginosa]|nr:hypothetical protein [Pseudomonas aeruginosa]
MEPVDLDHIQGMATGAGGAEHLVPRIRPAGPASSWWSPSTSITSRGWPPAPAAPSTWWRGSVRRGRRAPGGAVDLDHVQGMAIGAGGAAHLVRWIRPAWPASSWWSASTSITPAGGHRRRRRRAPGAVDPSGLAGEQLVERVDLDHAQGMAIGAGGAEHLVARNRPAWPASTWWSASTSITPRGWPSAPATPRTWCGGSVRRGRRAPGGAVDLDHAQGMAIGAGGAEHLVPQIRPARPASTWWSRRLRSRPGDAHRRRRRRAPGAVDPSGLAGEQRVEPVDLDHVQGMPIGAGGAVDLVY